LQTHFNHAKFKIMETYNEIFRDRTKKFALSIVNVLSEIKFSDALTIMRKQAIRSATSVAANYRATCRARSTREKYSKICIVVEESDEIQFWLEMLHEAKFLPKENFTKLHEESTELLKVMASFKKNLSNYLKT